MQFQYMTLKNYLFIENQSIFILKESVSNYSKKEALRSLRIRVCIFEVHHPSAPVIGIIHFFESAE